MRLAPPGPTRRQEQPDCEQDLWTHPLEAWPNFDPLRGGEVEFAHAVLLRASRSIVRARHDRKRRPLDSGVNAEAAESGEVDPPDAAGEKRRLRTERRLDLAPAPARLPADLHALADLLETHSVSEAARALGVARSSLQRTLARLRRHFAVAGLRPHHASDPEREVAHVRS